MFIINDLNEEQRRVIVNLEQHYSAWIAARRAFRALPHSMRWRARSGRDYLYSAPSPNVTDTSLGPRSAETERIFEEYSRSKALLGERVEASAASVMTSASLYRALKLPMISSEAAHILVECDLREMLGDRLMVVGTNAVPAYFFEASARVENIPDQTQDFDMALTSSVLPPPGPKMVMAMLKAVDPTFTMNTEREFQALNARAYEFELLAAPSTLGSLPKTDRPRPIALPEQEWLLPGRKVSQVVVGLDGTPARLLVPDPRWFALQKLWLSKQAKRNPQKKNKDAIQGAAILELVAQRMPHYPLDDAFRKEVPVELVSFLMEWECARRH